MRANHGRGRLGLGGVLAGLLMLVLAACGGGDAFEEASGGSTTAAGETLAIGTTSFAEAPIVAEMYRLLLEDAGRRAEVRTLEGRELMEPALAEGELDVTVEYVATLAQYLYDNYGEQAGAEPPNLGTLDTALQAARTLAAERGIAVLEPTGAVDSNQFFALATWAEAEGVRTLSDLDGKRIVVAAGEDCDIRPFCKQALEQTYGASVTVDPQGVDTPATFEAVQSGRAQVGLSLTTQPRLDEDTWLALEDDKGAVAQPDNVVAAVNDESVDDAARDALDTLAPVLTTDDARALVVQVQVERQRPEDVARAYLQDKGLLD